MTTPVDRRGGPRAARSRNASSPRRIAEPVRPAPPPRSGRPLLSPVRDIRSTDHIRASLAETAGPRVLVVASEAPPIVSGVSRTVDRLTSGMRLAGMDVDVISSNDIPRWTFGEARISAFPAHWRGLAQKFDQYDVVNLHGPAPTISDVFLSMWRTIPAHRRPALVYTHHSGIAIQGFGALCRMYDQLQARLAGVADRILVTSESYAAEMRRRGGPPVDIVPWGVDTETFGVPRTRRPERGHLKVLFVGQMRPYKGVPVLLRAVNGQPEIELTLVGGGDQERLLRGMASDLRMTNATFLGRVDDAELPRLYAEHDVIVLPSTTRAEAFGLVLLEGMAAGCVPVASDLPGVRDVAGGTGLLVEPGNVQNLRETLLSLADAPELVAEMGAASHALASALPWAEMSSRYVRSIQAALADAGQRQARSVLRKPLLTPESTLPSIRDRFGANWSSMLVFPSAENRARQVAWGRAAEPAHRMTRRPIAERIATYGRPVVLDHRVEDRALRRLLVRSDVGSAMAMPVEMRHGALAVVTVTLAADSTRRYDDRDLADFADVLAG